MGNVLFFFMLIFSVLISLSSSSWLICWMMMEISSFFFIPLLFGFWSVSSMMIGLKYFLIQSIGSSLFLFSVVWESFSFGGWEWVGEEKSIGMMTCLSMMLKLGVFPFSGWMLHISENLSWKNFFLLSSVQEVIPLVMISKFGNSEKLVFFFVCLSMVSLVSFCFVNYSVHWMMMISSLFNICWMIVASMIGKEELVFFLLVYFSTLFSFFWILNMTISQGSVAMISSFSLVKGGKMIFLFITFMMMGVPPLGSFLGKVEILSSMVFSGMIWLSIYFIFMSSIFMFLYLKISLSLSMEMKSSEVFKDWEMKTLGITFLMILSILFFLWVFYL